MDSTDRRRARLRPQFQEAYGAWLVLACAEQSAAA